MSQQPKVGPRSGFEAIANWARFSLNFSPISTEKMKLLSDLSATQCFLSLVHATGVYPPNFLPNSLWISVSVSGILSQSSWNFLIEKLCSEALKISLADLMTLPSKCGSITDKLSKILLLNSVLLTSGLNCWTGCCGWELFEEDTDWLEYSLE